MQRYRIGILRVSECRWSGFGRLRTQTGEIILYSAREDEVHLNNSIDSIGDVKSGKAPGIDSISADLLRVDTDTTVQILHELFSKIWEDESAPEGLSSSFPRREI